MAASNHGNGILAAQPPSNRVQTDNTQAAEASCSQEAPYSVFASSEKRWIVFLVAMPGFFSPLSANIYLLAINYLARDLHVSLELINLTITAYLVCQGIAPSLVDR
ncbi:MAG: hypothetical protein Q9213_006077 [Squamulea squamosa]